ncbi:glucosidase : Glycoside hydrolase, family 63 OS=Gemmatimonadetes bacterium KBS708 GN=J421_5672 PE=4 SV=1: Glyco_hydro_63 [Gemmataceae bacterium]|nr:glucosidase : Glycoside hydrolase, family 63 OS=Gemmatimonadetes bacterium KBS708 GN=J421_5672 PE=4 SV=1: Glyco_hydro_63 [Gemmataceae bacterium]VTU00812.1 glucosidase : Glycoside hydrolase, family 63 OS=Gemmatimonadetes bacterium KBS708 GN=J421_5672 PE=4 SV=1: Glyco_hydro_63 [Gemmataceae bacterium]
MPSDNPELDRLSDLDELPSWRRWGPYLSDRQWGTVREDYSPEGNPWAYFPFAHAHKRAYRWGEDGIAGLSDDRQRLCLALALWNGKDPILKERLFGLANEEGNHGEDVKEVYHYLDALPSQAYLKMLYKYPHARFPYERLREECRLNEGGEGPGRNRRQPEFELQDTGIFDDDRYFDVVVEYAKAGPRDVLMRVTAHNRGPDAAELHLLPTLWFRNTWSWDTSAFKPTIDPDASGLRLIHPEWSEYQFWAEGAQVAAAGGAGAARYLFTDNETNIPALYSSPPPEGSSGYYKDGINEYVVGGNAAAVNPANTGTKVAAHYTFTVPPGKSVVVRCRLSHRADLPAEPFAGFDDLVATRLREANQFYAITAPEIPDADARHVQRQAVAGLIWTKQFYAYDTWRWLKGDPAQPAPRPERKKGRNADWEHLKAADVLSMPDKWEYPYFCAWDTAFHAVAIAPFDPEFAKEQLLLMCREWYMHPNGQIPAYEWNFADSNPPVHAWAVWRTFQIDRKHRQLLREGKLKALHQPPDAADEADWVFLERAFHKLMINFTWWVNRKDAQGRNVFQGGFLGLDNIGVFDRSHPLPTGGFINQADGTAWMAMYSLNLMRIALELATRDQVYEDVAIKFFEHFLGIAKAMTDMAGKGIGLWNEEDGFYYDELSLPDGREMPLKVRSLVGLIPLFAVEVLEPELLAQVPEFAARMRWVLDHRPDLASLVSRWFEPGRGERRLLSLLRGHRVKRLLRRLLDEEEFLSPYGIRGLSRFHRDHPYRFDANGYDLSVGYVPGDSETGMFGGNSNWRGPVWFPVNYLIIESLQKFHFYYGDEFKVEYPTNSGNMVPLVHVTVELTRRLTRLFLRGPDGRRPCFGDDAKFQTDPHFRDNILFHEYFHGDTGRGLGASHQTGWTALVAKLLNPRRGERLYDSLVPVVGVTTETGVAIGAPAKL